MSEVSLDATEIVPNTTKYKLHQEQKETSDIIFAFKLPTMSTGKIWFMYIVLIYIPIFYEYRLSYLIQIGP